ncbi:hypothetical protein BDQ12DRAFT_670138 [Crucibulum laeve]|uniref:PUL domain-containing protein n=1 Tax=Crucibulum laeve TaxID=68775 RepID=A0A5C3LL73_9AGAR|nr:hypothetical protein BDQ12DRAFT_670138 [Crucibulum laeve]
MLFILHLQALLSFLPGLMLIVGRLFPSSSSSSARNIAFEFPPSNFSSFHLGWNENEVDNVDKCTMLCLMALKFMILLNEAKLGMVKKVMEFMAIVAIAEGTGKYGYSDVHQFASKGVWLAMYGSQADHPRMILLAAFCSAINTLEEPKPRVHSHVAAALITSAKALIGALS